MLGEFAEKMSKPLARLFHPSGFVGIEAMTFCEPLSILSSERGRFVGSSPRVPRVQRFLPCVLGAFAGAGRMRSRVMHRRGLMGLDQPTFSKTSAPCRESSK